jgi:PAS domain-containing protein
MNTPEVRFVDPPAAWPLRSWDSLPQAELLPGRHALLLRQQPERYSEMVEGVTAFGIYLIDRGGAIRSWNQGAQNITGLRRDEALGKPYE